MKLTLEKITDEMRKAYFEQAGSEPVLYSDTDNRIKAAATELYSAYSYAEYIFKQAFVQTATGKYLDYHAELRGLERKKAAFAAGRLTFSIAEPLMKEVLIPKGTICSVSGRPFIQFETTENAVIPAGSLSAELSAKALESGERYNALANEINVIVNPPGYVTAVVNQAAFTGGKNNETDESLRQRIIEIYKYESNALNEAAVKNMVLSCIDVYDAYISADDKTLYAVLRTSGGYVKKETENEINDKLSFVRLLGFETEVKPALAKEFSAFVDVKAYSGADFDEIKGLVTEKIKDFCGSEKIGKELRSYDIARALADIDYIEDVNILLSPSVQGTAVCSNAEYLKLEELQVTVHE